MSDTLIDRADGVVTVTFNRPHRKNALNAANWADLDQVLHEVARNPDDRALVLTGSGGSFSAGADLSGGLSGGDESRTSSLTGVAPQSTIHEMRHVGEIISRLQRLPKPTLAVVDGVAVGVALGLVLACDLIVASDRARFSEIFVRRGLALDGGNSWTLPRAVGVRRAKQMTFFGEMVSAQDALAWGLINEVVPVADLEGVAADWGRRLAAAPTTAVSLIKRLLDSSFLLGFDQSLEDEARAQHIAFTTDDMKEGIQAFLERREPQFRGT
ncbi:enoyl-CoA hydratase/isomerase family protein [Frankia sp. CNm7]|uniref:Enoyl-CoA hydratase/isomerase family protein n=1 Tax=Frankia nepalensis TaxID=1836974 RepID=A0A937RUT1_9ACTN|nr:enoyl-CoA hydratase-related protein [Frankia nepalensis]MBL7498697.1 enoyl-CoA hydratase/isomerase family protein [Frankia nepalensis]MBL7512919.1 enoyl-CoA hydratase/isomerase family protein [Frankia nepalensis]MBL7521653.1 enoyl-CoA hydratase/isomerase family protein [Frankia nepalensis]MBL7633218.1 enoyl-CoA hydratase/isomerase family protein [Frankia nepalensis]